MDKNIKISILFVACLIILIPSICAYCPPFSAKVDKIEPKIDCLNIDYKSSCDGWTVFVIKNNCAQSINFSSHLFPSGETGHIAIDTNKFSEKHSDSGCLNSAVSDNITICLDDLKKGDVLYNWTLYGSVGSQTFNIYGSTFYKKPLSVLPFVYFVIIFSLTLIIITNLSIVKKSSTLKRIFIYVGLLLLFLAIFLIMLQKGFG